MQGGNSNAVYNQIMKLYKFSVVIKPAVENKETYFQVRVPALPEIVTFGNSLEEAVFMAQDALELVVLSRLEDGENIPTDKKPSKISSKETVKEILISVVHNVNSTPFENAKSALA